MLNYNEEKLRRLEQRRDRVHAALRDVSDRRLEVRQTRKDAEQEVERQRKERRHLGGGVSRYHLRQVEEAREKLERLEAEETKLSEEWQAAARLVERCHKFLRDHGIDLTAHHKPGDSEIVHNAEDRRLRPIPLGEHAEYLRQLGREV